MKNIKPALTGKPPVPPGLRDALEDIYLHFDGREHIHPDPLEFLYHYSASIDREVAGFIASSLAYGRVRQILVSVRTVLDRMGSSPSSFLVNKTPAEIQKEFQSFKHRFTTGPELSALLKGLRKLIIDYGSLESCFLSRLDPAHKNVVPALSEFVERLGVAAGRKMPMFLPSPSNGSACKRLNLFLRWMVRHDNVDPGTWRGVRASQLIVPLDTHMHKIALALGLTGRKQADLRCAIEVTGHFAIICPEDPVRYDFALTRLGMNNGQSPQSTITNPSDFQGGIR